MTGMRAAWPELRTRGRPRKFERPSQVVALTLPVDVVKSLRALHHDLAHAVVGLVEKRGPSDDGGRAPVPPVELVAMTDRRALIVVNRTAFTRLAGVEIIPLDSERAFLALAPGSGVADLELAAVDRLEDQSCTPEERPGLLALRQQLKRWRSDGRLRLQTHAIIVAEPTQRKAGRPRRGR